MPLLLITGPANSGKARAVLDAVRAHAARGQEPLLVVPTRADVELYRRELAATGVVFGVRVERFGGLVEEIARRTGVRERPLGRLAHERVCAAVAARTPLRVLGGAATTPGFARALATLVAELESERVEPARLTAALLAWARASGGDGDGGRAHYAQDVQALYSAYRRTLVSLGVVDRQLRTVRALDALRRAPRSWGQTPVLFYGFDDLTRAQLDAVHTLSQEVDAAVTVSLAFEPGRLAFSGRATTFQSLAPLAGDHRRLAARAEHYAPAARQALHHLERSLFEPQIARADPLDALRLLEAGGERAEMELVAGEILALLDRGVAPAEIAVVWRHPAAVSDLLGEVFAAYEIPYTMERRLLFAHTAVGRGVIGLLRCALADGSVADLLAWLRTPGVLERPELADRLEAGALAAGVHTARGARALWEEGNWPLHALERLTEAQRQGPRPLLARVAAELEGLFSAPRRRRAAALVADELDEARALAGGRRACDELAQLSGPDGLPLDGRSLLDVLEGLELRGPAPAASDAVSVVDPLALRARRVRALFLCGCQEGVFPAPAAAEPFLSDEERRRLAEASGLRLARRDDSLGTERYLLYATVSRPEELLVLSWHTADDDGSPTAPSLFVADVCDAFNSRLWRERRRRELGAARWPGPDAPAGRRAAREAVLAARRRTPVAIGPLGDEHVLARLGEAVWSASALETWARCPVRWFVERLLRAEDLKPDPEPMVRGALAHAVLEETLAGLERETGSARMSDAQLPLARRLMRRALGERDSVALSARPERRAGALRRLEADLDRYLVHACRAGAALEPAHLELSFGFAEDRHPALDLGDGVRVRGRIDRVDVTAAGEAVVYDYKGRLVPEPARWVSDGRFQVAVYMRAVAELLNLKVVGGFYQPLGARDLRARGLLDEDAGLDLTCVNGDRRPHGEFEAAVAGAVALAREEALQARRGRLRAKPSGCAYGGGCRYPTICRCEI